jgi:hypothetical protein
MNQEILSNGIATNGKNTSNTITLNEISAVPWSNLRAYYQCRLTPLPMQGMSQL